MLRQDVTGRKAGCKGQPLPGSADVTIAAYDPDARRLILGDDGFAIPCARHDPGMLLARVRTDSIGTGEGVLRGVFEPGDAWAESLAQVGPAACRDFVGRHVG